jgi:hypothetical protein
MWPAITYVHVCMYLILYPSPYTQEDMLNYKSMDSFKNFQNGWVREVLVKEINQKKVVIGKVTHSQRLNEKPLIPWVITEDNGKILAANCNCIAGLGETCSHVASLLWAIAAGVDRRESLTVTQKSAYWVMPPAIKTVQYAPIYNIDFHGKRRKNMSISVESDTDAPAPSKKQMQSVSPTELEKDELFCNLSRCAGTKPAVLAIVQPYSEAYIPTTLDQDLPMVLSDFYEKECLSLGYASLLQKAKGVKLTITAAQVAAVKAKTRDQANSRVWFRMRTGRITASKFKSACRTDPANPSKSLILSVCHPEIFRFSNEATRWGCQHESIALEVFSNRSHHEDMKVEKCGLFISSDHPFLGASPDGIVQCSCCGRGICEVKCPYCHRDDTIEDAVEDGKFCLEKLSNTEDHFQLKRDHAYYYQVQAQLHCTGAPYCDFILYTNEDIFVERIEVDLSFLEENIAKAKVLFENSILPELLGRWYSHPPDTSTVTLTHTQSDDVAVDSGTPKYCYCQGGEYGEMVACDNSECSYQWFHLDCLKLNNPPKGKIWYCPDCRKLSKFARKSTRLSK